MTTELRFFYCSTLVWWLASRGRFRWRTGCLGQPSFGEESEDNGYRSWGVDNQRLCCGDDKRFDLDSLEVKGLLGAGEGGRREETSSNDDRGLQIFNSAGMGLGVKTITTREFSRGWVPLWVCRQADLYQPGKSKWHQLRQRKKRMMHPLYKVKRSGSQ